MPRTLTTAYWRGALALLFGLLGLLAEAAAHAAETAPPMPANLDAFRAEIAEILKKGTAPGAGIVLVRDGEVLWQGGIGLADRESGRPVDAHTRFRIGSISKQFVALEAMRLVEAGTLRLDMPVAAYAPELPIRNPWNATDPVRVVHLLEHTAGFDDMRFRNFNSHHEKDLLGELRHFDAELTSRWRPGERMAYSNPGYGAAAYVVEKIAGEDIRTLTRREWFEPLGMHRTTWNLERDDANLATGYEDDGRPAAYDDIALYPAGSIYSTPDDMAQLLRYWLSLGRSAPDRLRAESLERMEHPTTTLAARAGLDLGYGLANYASERAGLAIHGHSGGITGFVAMLGYSRERGIGYVVLLNGIDGKSMKAIEELSVRFLARDQAPLPKPGDLDRPGMVSADIAGWYAPIAPRNEIMAGVEWLLASGRLDVEGTSGATFHPTLIPDPTEYRTTGGALLRANDRVLATVVPVIDADGQQILAGRGIHMARGNFWTIGLPQYLLAAGALLLVSTLPFALVWLPRVAFGRLRHAPHKLTRALPLLAALSLFGLFGIGSAMQISDLVTFNAKSIAIAAFSGLFGVLAITSLAQSLRTWRGGLSTGVRWHSLLASLGAVGIAVWLWQAKLLCIRLWAW